MNLTLLGEAAVNRQKNKSLKTKQTTQKHVLVIVTASTCPFQLEPAGSERDIWFFSPQREEISQGTKRPGSEAPWAGPGQLLRHRQVAQIETAHSPGAKIQSSSH